MMRDVDSVKDILFGADVFVGGPIQHALSKNSIINSVRNPISLAIQTVTEAGGNVFSAHVAESFGKTTAQFTPSQVTTRDFRWMSKCDVFVPILPLNESGLLRTDGTHIELGWASAFGRPIVLVTQNPFHESASHLLKGLACVSRVAILDIDEFYNNPARLSATIAKVLGKIRGEPVPLNSGSNHVPSLSM